MLGEAIADLDRRVVLLASGGLSPRFWPLDVFRDHESSSLDNIINPAARAADESILAAWTAGDHASVIDGYPEYRTHAPEGLFGHYLMMVGALGGRDCRAPGVAYSDYEAAAGTGQIHMWFGRPEGGWTA
jgi:aromatic ring-opening dioxygenase catalytic subunit (LigB family)